jgi:hypothetical protein
MDTSKFLRVFSMLPLLMLRSFIEIDAQAFDLPMEYSATELKNGSTKVRVFPCLWPSE